MTANGVRPRVHVTTEGRGGTVHYEHAPTRFSMWWEFAGSEALAIIGIPTETHWEASTSLPLAQRLATLTFIGEQLVQQQTSGSGRFEIHEQTMTIYASRS